MSSHRTLEVTIISAKDLKNVNFFSALQVYAVATLSGDPSTRKRTSTDLEGRRNPTWNATFRFPISASVDVSRLTLDVLLRAERALGDRDVGEVHVPISELIARTKTRQFVSYQVRRPSGRGKGVLNFSYRFVDDDAAAPIVVPENKAEEPVTAYPVYPHPYAQPVQYPTPAGYPGYNLPPAGYPMYSQPPAGYGYGAAPAARPQQQPARKNKFGMGLGAGLLGGALGGLLIGDMVSDAAAYDAGYDAGFGDAGFDF